MVTGSEAANAATWRTLVKLLYEACGSPEVPGYPENQVRVILAGRRPIESRFTTALISACQARMQPAPFPAWYLPLEFGGVRIPAGHAAPVAPNVPNTSVGPIVAAAPIASVAPGLRPVAPARGAEPGADPDPGAGGGLGAGLSGGSGGAGSGPGSGPGAADTTTEGGGSVEGGYGRPRRRKARTGPPPDPAAATTAAQFMEAMRQLRNWAGMSLRDIEEASRRLNEGRDWIPRSSLADVLKRDTLPRPGLLETFTAALSLPVADRIRWAAARRRLADEAAGPMPTREHGQQQEQERQPERPLYREIGLEDGMGKEQEPDPDQGERQTSSAEAAQGPVSLPPGRDRWRPRFRRLGRPGGRFG